MSDCGWMGGDYSNSLEGKYDNALICRNGHVINSMRNQYPEDNKKYCEKCGSESLDKCEKCGIDIRGNKQGDIYVMPLFCYNCGNSFPWTVSKIEAAIELAFDSDSIDKDEKETFKNSIHEIVRDTPKTAIAATRFKKILWKIGNGTSKIIVDTISAIISETAKKIIFPEKP